MSQPSQSAAHPQYIWFNGKLVPGRMPRCMS